MKCSKCNSEDRVKRGFVKGRQRYMCKSCGYNYTVDQKSTAQPNSTKRKALQMYLEGLGFRSIGRILGVSHVAVYNWIKSFGSKVDEIKSDANVDIVEIDEMHSYIGDKKTTVGYGLLLIDLEKDSLTSLLATEHQQQEQNFGAK